jgi:hypothetical protein
VKFIWLKPSVDNNFKKAISLSFLIAIISASYSSQLFKITEYFAVLSAITCLFVMIIQSFDIKKPVQPHTFFSTLQILY